MTITDTIKELRELLIKATAGEWTYIEEMGGLYNAPDSYGAQVRIADVVKTPDYKFNSSLISAMKNALPDLLDAAEKAEQWRQMCESVQQTNLALIKKAERYEKALNGALAYLRNARIDLETGAPKRTAVNTLGGGIAMVESALAVGKDGA